MRIGLTLLLRAIDWLQLGHQQFEQHRFREAQASYLHATTEQPGDSAGWKALGLADLELKEYQSAYEVWLQADRLNGQDAKTKYLIGRLFFEAGLANEAAAWLRRALELAPHDYAAMTYLGLSAQTLNYEDTAAGLFRNAIYESTSQGKPYSWAYLGLAKLQIQRNDDASAMRTLEEASRKCADARILATYGELLAKTGRTQEAETTLRRAIDLDPTLSEPHYRMALLLKSEGREADSRAEMTRFRAAKAAETADSKVLAIQKSPAK